MTSKETQPTTEVDCVVKPLVPMALGELFGPVQCEHSDCCAPAWLIFMTQDEYDEAKSQEGTHPISFVFVNKIGTALCETHQSV